MRRWAVVGTGSRAGMYVDAMLGEHVDVAVPVAWCDTNSSRMAAYDERVRPHGHTPRHYHPDDLGRMLTDEKVDVVVVTSPDHTHAHVVTIALDAGVDVVCEKPLTIDAEGLRAIQRSVAASQAKLTVTFNYRYSPRNSALRQVIADGLVGEVLSVHFEWLLDTVHGADYFRRWHRAKRNSGGLAVHKATHHFDLVNWWLDDVPESVVALGGMRFYGTEGAGRPSGPRPARAGDLAADDPYHLDLAGDDRMRRLYVEAEPDDGYVRDHDVFAPGGDIEDTLNVLVGYRGGAAMSYSLTAHSPWEGYRVGVNGTRGRAELEVVERSHVAPGGAAQLLGPNGKRPAVDPSVTPGTVDGTTGARPHGARLVVQRHWGVAEEIPIPEGEGAHGGGDAILLRDLFRGATDDPLRRQAGHLDGMHSVSVGIAVNQSLQSGQPVRIADLGL
jgi:predicted dehydrogenase